MPGKITPKESNTISNIETRLGPVGKGHHNSHRTQALLDWLRAKEKSGSGKQASDSKSQTPPPAKGKSNVPPQFQKKGK